MEQCQLLVSHDANLLSCYGVGSMYNNALVRENPTPFYLLCLGIAHILHIFWLFDF